MSAVAIIVAAVVVTSVGANVIAPGITTIVTLRLV
jgi:hypothetical protein